MINFDQILILLKKCSTDFLVYIINIKIRSTKDLISMHISIEKLL